MEELDTLRNKGDCPCCASECCSAFLSCSHTQLLHEGPCCILQTRPYLTQQVTCQDNHFLQSCHVLFSALSKQLAGSVGDPSARCTLCKHVLHIPDQKGALHSSGCCWRTKTPSWICFVLLTSADNMLVDALEELMLLSSRYKQHKANSTGSLCSATALHIADQQGSTLYGTHVMYMCTSVQLASTNLMPGTS